MAGAVSAASLAMDDQLTERCRLALGNLRAHAYAEPFVEPVDPVKLNLPDYFNVVKQPMDLGTVSNKLGAGQYATFGAFAADVRLVFSNAIAYNSKPSEHAIRNMAQALTTAFARFEAQVAEHPVLDETQMQASRKSRPAALEDTADDEGDGDATTGWVACDSCGKWRRLGLGVSADSLPERWTCADNTWDPIYASCESPDEPESTEPALPPKASSGKKGKGGGSRSRKSGGGDASDTARARGGSAKKGAVTTDMNGASPADADHAAAATGAKRKRADTGPVNAAETTATTASTSSSSVLGGSPAPAPAPASAQPPAKKARGKAAETIASRFPPGSPEHTFWMGLELTWDDLGLHGPSRRMPSVNNVTIDLHALYKLVMSFGGYDVVNGVKGGWTAIYRDMPGYISPAAAAAAAVAAGGTAPSAATHDSSGSFRLKKSYEGRLLEYERRIAAGWDPLTAPKPHPVLTKDVILPNAGHGVPASAAARAGAGPLAALMAKLGTPGAQPLIVADEDILRSAREAAAAKAEKAEARAAAAAAAASSPGDGQLGGSQADSAASTGPAAASTGGSAGASTAVVGATGTSTAAPSGAPAPKAARDPNRALLRQKLTFSSAATASFGVGVLKARRQRTATDVIGATSAAGSTAPTTVLGAPTSTLLPVPIQYLYTSVATAGRLGLTSLLPLPSPPGSRVQTVEGALQRNASVQRARHGRILGQFEYGKVPVAPPGARSASQASAAAKRAHARSCITCGAPREVESSHRAAAAAAAAAPAASASAAPAAGSSDTESEGEIIAPGAASRKTARKASVGGDSTESEEERAGGVAKKANGAAPDADGNDVDDDNMGETTIAQLKAAKTAASASGSAAVPAPSASPVPSSSAASPPAEADTATPTAIAAYRAWALCAACPAAQCLNCLLPSPSLLGLPSTPAGAATLAAALAQAGRQSRSHGACSAAGAAARLSDVGFWLCNACTTARAATSNNLPWCRVCSGSLLAPPAAPAGGGGGTYFGSLDRTEAWPTPAAKPAQAPPASAPAAAGAPAPSSAAPAPAPAAAAASATAATDAKHSFPAVIRCESCSHRIHGACAARSGAVEAEVDITSISTAGDDASAGGGADTRPPLTRKVYLCHPCASRWGAASTVASNVGDGRGSSIRLRLNTPSPAYLALAPTREMMLVGRLI